MDITDRTVAASVKLSETSARWRMHMRARIRRCPDRLSQRSPPATTLVAHSPLRTVPSCRPRPHNMAQGNHQASAIQAAQTHVLGRVTRCTHNMRSGVCASTLARRCCHQNHCLHSQTCALSSNGEAWRKLKNGSRDQNRGLEHD